MVSSKSACFNTGRHINVRVVEFVVAKKNIASCLRYVQEIDDVEANIKMEEYVPFFVK